eukprot:SAG11_NODE_22256_length_409_cov_1.003226_1_plen_94_part_10
MAALLARLPSLPQAAPTVETVLVRSLVARLGSPTPTSMLVSQRQMRSALWSDSSSSNVRLSHCERLTALRAVLPAIGAHHSTERRYTTGVPTET